jgi:hypothetical protein
MFDGIIVGVDLKFLVERFALAALSRKYVILSRFEPERKIEFQYREWDVVTRYFNNLLHYRIPVYSFVY